MPEKRIHRLSREELHKAAWSEAMRVLAPRFGVSDVALAKACRRASVPVPERGYWAKQRTEKGLLSRQGGSAVSPVGAGTGTEP
jgi:hypothetical protein